MEINRTLLCVLCVFALVVRVTVNSVGDGPTRTRLTGSWTWTRRLFIFRTFSSDWTVLLFNPVVSCWRHLKRNRDEHLFVQHFVLLVNLTFFLGAGSKVVSRQLCDLLPIRGDLLISFIFFIEIYMLNFGILFLSFCRLPVLKEIPILSLLTRCLSSKKSSVRQRSMSHSFWKFYL
jgi:hypothetical protein